MTDDVLLVERANESVVVVTLNRPAKRNAIDSVLAARIEAVVRDTEGDDTVRAIVLASSHDTVFSAGADLGEIAAGRGHLLTTAYGFAGFADAPRTKPWIAAVRGAALAGGCELALACDMIVATPDSRFGLPEVQRGLFAAAGGVHRLARAIPRNVALELIATGEPIAAERAYALGLVNHLVAPERLREAAIDLARTIAGNAPLSVRESLAVARLAAERSDAELRELSRRAAAVTGASDDAREGPAAFLEKRAPRWTGR